MEVGLYFPFMGAPTSERTEIRGYVPPVAPQSEFMQILGHFQEYVSGEKKGLGLVTLQTKEHAEDQLFHVSPEIVAEVHRLKLAFRDQITKNNILNKFGDLIRPLNSNYNDRDPLPQFINDAGLHI